MNFLDRSAASEPKDLDGLLCQRLDPSHLRRRMGIESDHEAQVFGQGKQFFHIENWYSIHALIRGALRLSFMHGRGQRNATALSVEHNSVVLANLPQAFEGYRILQISDLHLDMREDIPRALIDKLAEVEYDLCVLTGDFRAKTYGPFEPALQAMAQVRPHISTPAYGVLGNHDSIRMVPGLENLDIRMLMNESVAIQRGGDSIYLGGIDDPHYYCTDNLDRTSADIPREAVSVLLSHTPESYRHAAYDGFDLMLCGHTHGGQICLPGGTPLMCNARCPREYCSGTWCYGQMQAYTSRGSGVSVVDVRLNCSPEITVHELRRA